jgi:hypothetical protein
MKNLNLFFAFIFFYSCGDTEFATVKTSASAKVDDGNMASPAFKEVPLPGEEDQSPPTKKDADKPVCNPFGGESLGGNIKAKLYEGDKTVKEFADFKETGKVISEEVYMSSLEVPVIAWDEGFSIDNGEPLKNSEGEVLFEWFGLEMTSNIRLRDEQQEGYYIFSSFADDGFSLDAKFGDQWITLVNRDIISAPRFHCYTTTGGKQSLAVRMTKNSELKVEMTYFQGPRVKIALSVFMRKVADLSDFSDELVDVNGENFCQKDRFGILEASNYFLLDEKKSCE